MHLLDVGRREYGDAVLCQLGTKSVLIDGAHKGDQELITEAAAATCSASRRVRTSTC